MDSSGALKLGAMAAFACPISERVRCSVFGEEMKNSVIELHRLAAIDEWRAQGFKLSMFISKALKKLWALGRYNAVISFADSTENHSGGIYRASNFIYCGSVERHNVFFRDKTGRIRHSRQNGKNITKEEALAQGWKVEDKRGTLHRYIYIRNEKLKKHLILKEKTFFKESNSEIAHRTQELSGSVQLSLWG